MKKMRLLALTALLALVAVPVWSDDLMVIANPSVTASEVSGEDLKQLFLGTKSSLAGSTAEPVLAESGAAHEAFLKKYLGKSDSALRMHLKSLVFSGKASMPKSFGNDAAIVAYVAKTKGAVGYVSAGASAGTCKKLAVH